MKTTTVALFLSVLMLNALFAQVGGTKVSALAVKANATVAYQGNLSQGQTLTDLRWAANSSVACFPATQNHNFSGNHVFYTTTIPRRSEMFIKVTPQDASQNFNLYAYEVGLSNQQLPPNLNQCITCEAAHKRKYKVAGTPQDHTRQVRLNAINNPYKVVIGVVGAEGLTEGAYRLEIELIGGEDVPNSSANVEVTPITLAGALTTVQGNLETGTVIHDLSWAANSSVACFPATQNKKFSGKHVVYEVQLPRYSEMTLMVAPKDQRKNLSLYAYSVGASSDAVVPNLSRCVSCEADHKWDRPRRGRTQDHTRSVSLMALNNPYKVYVGVVGAEQLAEGDFELRIEVKSR